MTHIREIEAASAHRALLDGAILLDVREPHELGAQVFTVPNSLHVPLGEVLDGRGLPDLPRDRTLIVACLGGWRSANATAALQRAGFDALNLGGGWLAWAAAGLPAREDAPVGACGCGCDDAEAEADASAGACGCGDAVASDGFADELPVTQAGCGCASTRGGPCC